MTDLVRSSHIREATILVAYYNGAYGPTVRIDVQSASSLAQILACVQRLSSGDLGRVSLGEFPSVVIEPPLSGITLLTIPDSSGVRRRRKRLTREAAANGTFSLAWAQTVSEWEDTAALIEGLYAVGTRGKSGHQYLTDESTGDVLIELALKE